MSRSLRAALVCAALLLPSGHAAAQGGASLKLKANRVSISGGRSFTLNLPESFAVAVAAEGFRRPRFMARASDGRVFVTDMHSLADNEKGAVYVLEGFDPSRKSFAKTTPYLKRLRNPNSVAFHTDAAGVEWLYLALTDRLVRYRYEAGADAPAGLPEVLTTFPDYGLNYKYGGWHLTRTVVAGDGKIYVSVGSSCNACVEREEVRASVIEMDPDGSNRRVYARGLRNAVGMRWVNGRLFATNMGADHLGEHRPADTLYALTAGADYGWPYCYQSGMRVFADVKFRRRGRVRTCRGVPNAFAAFDAHSSPLGLEHFGAGGAEELEESFLVALHGSGKRSLGRGYSVARVRADGRAHVVVEDFMNGFLRAGKVQGRPADVFKFGRDSFLLTDDHAGIVYYVYRK
ncbi:MAG TPA: PQQ-dependent sugar dehydrogenase [Pyrinomonadaceae bacterium]|nr:PQQ-dependent sugar dehydrogenase [Pyrinomonadaceae bacterium]